MDACTRASPRSPSRRRSILNAHGRDEAQGAAAITHEDDAELVSAAQHGDQDALERLLRAHYDRLFRLCRRVAGNDADASDAAQEALLAIVRGLPNFDGRASFTTWTYRIATNACLDEMRRRRRRPEPTDDDVTVPDARDVADEVADRVSIDDALAALPDEFRVAVVLRDVCALDYAEIASVLDIPPGTVRSRIARGRAAIADRLGNRTSADERQTPRP